MNDLLRTSFSSYWLIPHKKLLTQKCKMLMKIFVKQIVTISNSEDYTHIFRMLNLTRIEIAPLKGLYQDGQGENALKIYTFIKHYP